MRAIRVWLSRRLRHDTRILRLDPHVPVGAASRGLPLPPTTIDSRWESLWRSRVAENVARRQARADREDALPAFLCRQAD